MTDTLFYIYPVYNDFGTDSFCNFLISLVYLNKLGKSFFYWRRFISVWFFFLLLLKVSKKNRSRKYMRIYWSSISKSFDTSNRYILNLFLNFLHTFNMHNQNGIALKLYIKFFLKFSDINCIQFSPNEGTICFQLSINSKTGDHFQVFHILPLVLYAL